MFSYYDESRKNASRGGNVWRLNRPVSVMDVEITGDGNLAPGSVEIIVSVTENSFKNRFYAV